MGVEICEKDVDEMPAKKKPGMLNTGVAELLEKQPVTEGEKTACIRELQSTVKNMAAEIAELKEMVLWLRKQLYGSKSEKTSVEDSSSQLGLFNEAEQEFKTEVEEPTKKDNRGYHIRKQDGKWKLVNGKDIGFEDRVLALQGEDLLCPHCGTEMTCIGKEVVREEPVFVPAKLKIIRYIQPSYCCPCCKKKGIVRIAKLPAPKPLLNHSTASASVVAEVMHQKYVQAVPLYRQEAQWKDVGIAFSRTTMANWVIRCSQDWLSLVYDHMRAELLRREVLHADETPVQVLKENGKTAASKSYMWVYRTGNDGLPPVVLFEYQPGRSGEYPKKFLEGFHWYLHTDGYAGYNKVEGITRCGCWAHLRRKFVDALPPEMAELVGPPSTAKVGREYCDQLFAAEKKIQLLPPENRQQTRLEVEEPMLRAFWCWLEKVAEQPLGGKLKTAVEYALRQRPYMENYLKDPRCQISNNLAENAIRPFTVGRKNWLFSDSVEGAKASAVIYSIVETAKANHISARDYLRVLLEELPDWDVHEKPENIEYLLPWGEYIQERFE